MSETRLAVNDVSVEFTGLRALDHVSLSVAAGEVVGLIGPNGSGKTTLINAITGQVKLATGTIAAGDTTLSGLSPREIALAGVSRSFQIVRIFNSMTVMENVEAAALAKGASRTVSAERAKGLLAELGLTAKADELGESLSYGDKRRVEIARALAAEPRFLLLDEPAAGMNDAETETLLHTLAELPEKRGLGLLIIDHDMGLIMRLCHRLHVLASGRTIAEGDAAHVRSHPAVIEAYLGKGRPMLDVTDLSVSYGAIRAVRSISFTLRKGELVSLLGANGAGKSSTIKCIAGALKASGGTITLEGKDITAASPEQVVRAGLATVPETRDVFPDLTVAENLMLGAFIHRRDQAGNRDNLEKLNTLFPRLAERSKQAAGTLSGGEQQMLVIARALMARPRVLLLDEPSLGLAPAIVERIFEMIETLKKSGLTILLVEQNVNQALAVADRAFVMRLGAIVASGTAEEIRSTSDLSAHYLGG